MKKIGFIALCGLALSGCNATVSQPIIYPVAPRPVLYTQPAPMYLHRPYCFTSWERTPRGMVERRICRR